MQLANITSRYRAKLIMNTYRSWLPKNASVLDVGCGTGVVGDYLASEKNLKITGCDIQKYHIKPIDFKLIKDPQKLPFPNNSFDIAMFNDVLHHIDYQTQIKLLKEAMRVSKKSVLLFELKPTFSGKVFDYLLNKIHNPKMAIPYTYRTKSEWIDVFSTKLKSKYDLHYATKPVFYPFTHIGFRLRNYK